MGQPISYYVSGHTARGSVNYFHENAQGINHVVVLKHDHPQVVSALLKAMMAKQKLDGAEVILDPYGAGAVGGVLYRDAAVAFAGDRLITKRKADIHYTDVDLSAIRSMPVLQIDEELLQASFQQAYTAFKTGLEIHDELEAIYVAAMDFALADEAANVFLQQLFPEQGKATSNSKPLVYPRLFGTNTLSGMENVVLDLLKPLQKRVYVKGRAGTGKSVFMKKVWEACRLRGLDVEVYHCSFDPDSIDMLIVRALGFGIFDSTAPHEFFPERKEDEVIDLYTLTVAAGTDERHAAEINRLTKAYKAEMKRGLEHLMAAKALYPPVPDEIPVQEMMHQLEKDGILK